MGRDTDRRVAAAPVPMPPIPPVAPVPPVAEPPLAAEPEGGVPRSCPGAASCQPTR